MIHREGTTSENVYNPTQERSQQSQKIVEREDDEDVKVFEVSLSKKRVSKGSKGKKGKTEAEDEEDRGVAQESSQQSQKRIEREDDEDVMVFEVPVKKKTTLNKPRGKMLSTEDEDKEDRGARWKDDEDIEMLIALRGEMDDDFKKTTKNKVIGHNEILVGLGFKLNS